MFSTLKRVMFVVPILALFAFALPAQAQASVQVCEYTGSATIQANVNLLTFWMGLQFTPGTYYSDGATITGQSTGATFTDTPQQNITSGNQSTDTTVIWASTTPAGAVWAAFLPGGGFAGAGDVTEINAASWTTGACVTLPIPGSVPQAINSAGFTAPPPPPPPGLPTNSQQGLIIPLAADYSVGDSVEAGLRIWGIDSNGEGFIAVDMTGEEFANLPANPDSNVTIFEGDGVGFYVLDTGELQVNFGPTSDGWVDVIVFDRDLNITNTYRWNIFDVLD